MVYTLCIKYKRNDTEINEQYTYESKMAVETGYANHIRRWLEKLTPHVKLGTVMYTGQFHSGISVFSSINQYTNNLTLLVIQHYLQFINTNKKDNSVPDETFEINIINE